MELQDKLNTLAEIIDFGLDFIEIDASQFEWFNAQIECLANQISSALSQWVTKDSVETGEIIEFFGFDNEDNWDYSGRTVYTKEKILALLNQWVEENN